MTGQPAGETERTEAVTCPGNGSVSAKAEGPSRRKSNLHNAMAADMDSSWDRQTHIEGRFKKYSTTSSVYSKKALSQQSEYIERSWWYACCQKCHSEDSGIPSWEPPNWQKVCPYPLCPSYRQFAQNIAVLIIGILVWVIVWIVMGETAAPGGQLFSFAVLTIAAYFGGWLMLKITTLPALIGMLIVGIIMKNAGLVNFDETYQHVASYIRKIALTIILTRAGLDLDPNAMKKYFLTVIKLALREKGYGVSKGIPTLVLAVSGVDDAASVAVFGIVSSIMFSSASLTMNVIQGPLSVIGGIVLGILCGYLVKFVPERNDAFLVPLRVILLLAGGLMMVLGSEEIGWGGADLEPHLVLIGGGILVLCAVLRAIVTSTCAVRSNLNMKEKIFVGLAWMAKATVQAALGPVALDEVRKMAGGEPDPVMIEYAETVITVCIMSIVITAPIGAIVITLTGPKLLSRTTKPPVLEVVFT
ncbi:hypothetical protein HF086_018421 [Spodoptera exigua]|uniref:Cation/H+ exchanger domain-containing protein n=1 Tax=Spodoptera exigua TaxID=7107 RepID=A0A922SN43_SPOEX|nr:hypothetical protein HF086_018421 [Spodoptera exigua]